MDLSGLSDQELLGKLEALTETERFSMADFLLHLAEVDRRRACERTSHGTLFAYLTRRLGFSEADAVRRIKAARAADKYPSILRMLAAGELHLIGVSMLEPVLTSENHERLLRRASRRSTREIEAMAASLSAPEPGPKDRIRALPPPCKPPPAILDEIAAPPEPLPGLEPTPRPDPAEAAPTPGPRVVFTFTASEEVRDWFEQARDLLRHRFPMGRMEDIVGEALRSLVERKRTSKAWRRQATGKIASNTRRIPMRVRDEVWRRDGGRCSYVAKDGACCGERGWLEFDHVLPYALGGRSDDPGNLRLLCRTHNGAEARRVFGAKAGLPA